MLLSVVLNQVLMSSEYVDAEFHLVVNELSDLRLNVLSRLDNQKI